MTAYLKKHKRLAVLLGLLLLLIPLAVWAADNLKSGADDVSNSKQGDIGYNFEMCFDGTYWDRERCTTETAPKYVQSLAPVFDADDTAACLDIPAAETDYTLTHDATMICANGNTVYILCAAAAPVTADHTTGNFSLVVFEGTCIGPFEFTGLTVCSYIGVVATGQVCFLGLDYN